MIEKIMTININGNTHIIQAVFPENKISDILVIKQSDRLAGFSAGLRKEISEIFEPSEVLLLFPLSEANGSELSDIIDYFCENNNILVPELVSAAYYDNTKYDRFQNATQNLHEIKEFITAQKISSENNDLLITEWKRIPDRYKEKWDYFYLEIINEKIKPEYRTKKDLIRFSLIYGFTLEMAEEILNYSGYCFTDCDSDLKAIEMLKNRTNFDKWLKEIQSPNDNSKQIIEQSMKKHGLI